LDRDPIIYKIILFSCLCQLSSLSSFPSSHPPTAMATDAPVGKDTRRGWHKLGDRDSRDGGTVGGEEGRPKDGPVEPPDRSICTPSARYFRAHHGARPAHYLRHLVVPRQGMPGVILQSYYHLISSIIFLLEQVATIHNALNVFDKMAQATN
jgi:hypothetical protein